MLRLKRLVYLFVCFIVGMLLNCDMVLAVDLDVSAKSAILICADSGSVLWSKNETQPLPMASTTKIMTALLTLEHMQACVIKR